jgi:hypothetical protein
MSTAEAPYPDEIRERVRGLLDGLVDDAAVFPPALLTVRPAVEAHRAHRLAWYGEVVGPLLVRASDVGDLVDSTRPGDDVRIGIVADDGLVSLVDAMSQLFDQEERATLQQVEIALPPDHEPARAARVLLDQLSFSTTAYVELPRGDRPDAWLGALDVLAEDGAERAKLRTGGAGGAPSEAELAAFVRACLDRRLPFKLTAGLHHAVRCTTTDGDQHGLLNVLAAVQAGQEGASAADLAQLLGVRSLEGLIGILARADVPRVRGSFTSFGCCAVTDPVDELHALGLLTADGG